MRLKGAGSFGSLFTVDDESIKKSDIALEIGSHVIKWIFHLEGTGCRFCVNKTITVVLGSNHNFKSLLQTSAKEWKQPF